MATPEKQIENSILEYLHLKGLYCWKNQSVGIYDPTKKAFRRKSKYDKNGVSDILGILPNGTLLAIEVKLDNTPTTKKTYPSKEQKEFIENINNNKGIAFVARSVRDVELVLVKILGPKFACNGQRPLDS